MFKCLQEANLTLKPSKCIFGKKEIEFTGHVINDGRITPTKENVEKIQKAARPSTKKGIRSFLGLTGYYRNFIPNYSAVAAPMTDLTRNGGPNNIEWTEECFNVRKGMLSHSVGRQEILEIISMASISLSKPIMIIYNIWTDRNSSTQRLCDGQ